MTKQIDYDWEVIERRYPGISGIYLESDHDSYVVVIHCLNELQGSEYKVTITFDRAPQTTEEMMSAINIALDYFGSDYESDSDFLGIVSIRRKEIAPPNLEEAPRPTEKKLKLVSEFFEALNDDKSS